MKVNTAISDNDLAVRIRLEDETAFETLFTRYHAPLMFYLQKRLRCPDLARELTQQTFIRVWNNRARLDGRLSLRAYLYRIAGNLVIDHFRKVKVEQRSVSEMALRQRLSTPESDSDLREIINNTLKQLPQPVQIVFALSRFQGLKNREIAEMLEISVKTVEGRISKALQALRQINLAAA